MALGDDEEDGSISTTEKTEKLESSKGYESENQTMKEEKEEGEISPTLDDGVEEVERRLGKLIRRALFQKICILTVA